MNTYQFKQYYTIILIFILFISVIVTLSTTAAPKSTKNTNNKQSNPNKNNPTTTTTAAAVCKSLSSELKFAAQPPRSVSDLSFCKEYRHSTCCNRTHTQLLVQQIYPYFDTESTTSNDADLYNSKCSSLAASILCAPCSPGMGTGSLLGYCESTCNEFYSNCRRLLFTHTETTGRIQPCNSNSDICSPLESIVHNGIEFCESIGLKVINDRYNSNSNSNSNRHSNSRSNNNNNDLIAYSNNPTELFNTNQKCFSLVDSDNAAASMNTGTGTGSSGSGSTGSTAFKRAEDVYKPTDSNNNDNNNSYFNQFQTMLLSIPLQLQRYQRQFQRYIRQLLTMENGILLIIIAIIVAAVQYRRRYKLTTAVTNRTSAILAEQNRIREARAERLTKAANTTTIKSTTPIQ